MSKVRLFTVDDTYGNEVHINPEMIAVIRKTKYANTAIHVMGYGAIYTNAAIPFIRRQIEEAREA